MHSGSLRIEKSDGLAAHSDHFPLSGGDISDRCCLQESCHGHSSVDTTAPSSTPVGTHACARFGECKVTRAMKSSMRALQQPEQGSQFFGLPLVPSSCNLRSAKKGSVICTLRAQNLTRQDVHQHERRWMNRVAAQNPGENPHAFQHDNVMPARASKKPSIIPAGPPHRLQKDTFIRADFHSRGGVCAECV